MGWSKKAVQVHSTSLSKLQSFGGEYRPSNTTFVVFVFLGTKPRYFTSISSNYDNLTWKFLFFALFFSLPFRYLLKYRPKLYYSILVPMNVLRITSDTKKAFCDNIPFYLSSITLSSQSLQTQYHTLVGLALVIVSPTLISLFLLPFLAPLAVVIVDTKADATANATTVAKTNMISNKS